MAFHTEANEKLPASQAGTVRLGDLLINRLAFGTMRLTGPGVWGDPANPEEARRVLRRAVELGVNYLDTAAYYGPLVTDRLIVEALYPYPAQLVIGTKVGGWRSSDKHWTSEAHPKQLKATLEDSLSRLRLEQLQLVHFRFTEESSVPFGDSLGALVEFQQVGKIRHIGLSNVALEQIHAAEKMTSIASIQNLYNLADRTDEPIVEYCTEHGIPFLSYFPLAMGRLGKTIEPLGTIARDHQATPAQVTLAWLLARSPQMVLIPGTSSVAHLEENLAAAGLQLSDEEWQALAKSPEIAALPRFRY
jgi:pyridoxine 4-dehydrogenase